MIFINMTNIILYVNNYRIKIVLKKCFLMQILERGIQNFTTLVMTLPML